MSIVDYSIAYPAPMIDQTNFPITKTSCYWSSNTYAPDPSNPWVVSFSDGAVRGYGKPFGQDNYVRCVRGGMPTQTLVDNSNGTVTDNITGLMWQQGEPGFKYWSDALSYCVGLSHGGHTDWWLPNIRELESLTDVMRSSLTIDTSFFPNAHESEYWSSTTDAYFPGYAWKVGFTSGGVCAFSKGMNYVRCVRAGESGALLTAWIVGTAKYFNLLQRAHDSAVSGNTAEAEAGVFAENLTVSKDLTLMGGFDGSYASNAGYTTLQGGLTVQSGSLTVENLIVM
jgi:hypothetical protein